MNKKPKYKKLLWRSVLFWSVMVIYVFLLEMLAFIALRDVTIPQALAMPKYWIVGISVSVVLIAGYYSIKGVYGYMKSYNEEAKEKPFWLESRQLKRFGFKITDWTKPGVSASGHVIGVEEMQKGVSGIVSNAKTTAVFGCMVGAPAKAHIGFNLDKWQSDKSKPTIFIFDTKKEILNHYNVGFEEAGFEMLEIDFHEPLYGNGWNPFTGLLEKMHAIKELANGLESKDGKYQGAGETFQTYKAARERLQAMQSELVWHIQSLIDDILPKYEGGEAEEDAKTIVLGLMIAFTEDFVSGKLESKQFSLYSLFNAMEKGAEDTEQLRQYLMKKRTKYSLARITVKDVFADAKALKSAMDIVHRYVKDLDDETLLLSVSSENVFDENTTNSRVVFIRLSTETGIKERLSKLFLKQVCFHEKIEQNVKFLLKGNMPLELYDPFLMALKDKKLDAIMELNNVKEIQERYADMATEMGTWFDEKIWFHGSGKEIEYIEFCKDNTFIPKSKLEMSMPMIQQRVLDKVKDEDVVLTCIKGLKPIFTTFEPYDYGNEKQPNMKRIALEEVMDRVYDIASFERDFS